MIILNTIFVTLQHTRNESFAAAIEEVCSNEPKPLYCELPDDLKVKRVFNSGTQTYSYNSLATPGVIGMGGGTST